MSASKRWFVLDGRRAGATLALAVIILLDACAPAPLPPPARTAADARGRAAAPGRAAVKESVLPSGLRIVLEEDPHATLAGVVSVVRGGSSLDPPGAEGLAHLVEHLTYRAVDPSPAGERSLSRWNRLIRLAAADVNGYTTHDHLMFYAFAAPRQLRALLDLEAARLADPLAHVDERALELERQVVGSEDRFRSDPRAGAWAANALFARLFPPGHPYARSPGGTDESRSRLTLAGARDYVSRSFRPDRMTLLVTAPPGATSLAAIGEALSPALRAGAPGATAVRAGDPGVAAAPVAATRGTPASALVPERRASPLSVPELWLAWTLPGSLGQLGVAEDLLRGWAQEDLRSRSFMGAQRQVRHISARLRSGVEASVLYVRVILAADADAARVAQAVAARLADLWTRDAGAQAALNALGAFSETARLLDEPGQRERALERAMAASLAPPGRSSSGARAVDGEATLVTVTRLARQQLAPGLARAVVFSPELPAAAAAPDRPRAAPAIGREPAATPAPVADLVPGAAAWDVAELSLLLPPAPAVVATQLPGGLTVVTVRRPGAAITAWLGFRGGYADIDPPLLVELAMRARPDAQQAARLHMLPSRGATRDLSFDSVEFPAAQLPEALALLFAKATASIRDWPSREDLDRLLAAVAAGEDGHVKRADRAFWRALFGDHRYARIASADDLGRLTRADVDAWLARVHHLRSAILVVVGDVNPVEVERGARVLSQQFKPADSAAELATPPAAELRAPGGERVLSVVTARPGGLADIRLGCLLPPMRAADRGHYELLKNAVKDRLNTSLRIEQGDGYGVAVDYEWLRDGTTFMVAQTFVPDEALAPALVGLRGQWQRWGRDGFDAGEINVARWRYAADLAAEYDSPDALAFRVMNQWSAEPAALASGTVLRPDVVGPDARRVGELFATCKANAVLGVTGNEALIRQSLRAAWPELQAAPRPPAR